jgi:hypothetical protein
MTACGLWYTRQLEAYPVDIDSTIDEAKSVIGPVSTNVTHDNQLLCHWSGAVEAHFQKSKTKRPENKKHGRV